MRRIFPLLALLLLCSPFAFAAHVDTLGIGAKASAMGGAFTAQADDFSALYYNPAGLAQISDRSVSIGAAFVNANLAAHGHITDRAGGYVEDRKTAVKDNTQLLVYPHWGLVYPIPGGIFGKKATFAVGGYVPYGLWHKENPDPKKNVLAYSAYEAYYYRIVHAQPTIAVQLTDRLYLGFGIAFGESRAAQKKRIYVPAAIRSMAWLSPEANAVSSIYDGKLKLRFRDDFNWSFNVGLLYKLRDNLRIGLTYRSETKTRFYLTGTAYNRFNQRLDKVHGHMCYDHPEQVALGVMWRPIPRWTLEADIEWVHWDRNSYMKVSYNHYLLENYFRQYFSGMGIPKPLVDKYIEDLKKQGVIHKSVYIKRRWSNTVKFHVGTQYQVNQWLSLRAGYLYDPSSVPESTLEMGFVDVARQALSLGAGIKLFGGRVLVDVAYQYLTTSGRRIVGRDDSDTLNRDFAGADNSVWIKENAQYYAVTLTYKF